MLAGMTSRLESAATPPEPVRWPEGYTAAACLTFDMDAEAAVLTADIGSVHRMSPMSHQAYGPLVGVPRILNLLARNNLRATFFVPGYSAHRYPAVVRSIAEAGHEIAHHSYFHENTIGMDARTEADMLDLGLQALWDVAGVRPEGYRAPMWELNYHTPRLLAERGFRYDSSLMDSDHPYRLAVGDAAGSTLIEIPAWWGLDDWEQYAFLPEPHIGAVIESPAKVLDLWTGELDALAAEGGLMVLTSHPFLSGRASRVATLERVIEHARTAGGIWIAPLSAIAAHTRAVIAEADARPVPSVHIEEGIYER
jgi:peptidoglycan-N-acetylglucosamine deacetylase